MTIQQGFNRIGLAVAAAFVGLSLICLAAAATNYLDYRSEISESHKKFFGKDEANMSALELLKSPAEKLKSWKRFKDIRYRSVGQALSLALMCWLAGLIALVFWYVIGRFYILASARYQRRYG